MSGLLITGEDAKCTLNWYLVCSYMCDYFDVSIVAVHSISYY